VDGHKAIRYRGQNAEPVCRIEHDQDDLNFSLLPLFLLSERVPFAGGDIEVDLCTGGERRRERDVGGGAGVG
jgi:hypothetical protein